MAWLRNKTHASTNVFEVPPTSYILPKQQYLIST